ncbi:MAG: DUF3363 domain-containing protein, partial [Gemmobacter sp.]
ERLDADRWTIPADLPERGLAQDRQKFGKGPRIETLSDLPLDRQVGHEGATWLDRTMIGGGRETMPHTGFGGDVRAAWEARGEGDAAERAARAEAAQARAEALARALAALEAASPDRSLTTAALARARDVVAQADRDIQALTVEHGRLTTLIDLRAGEGVEEDLADTTDRLAEATARRDALRFEVEMLKTLLAALETARAAARDRYVAPVLRELTPLLRLLWPDAEIAFDEDRLLPVAMTRAGQAEAIEILSGGTQEQVALLVRLAFARMLAAAGRAAPVILDDALVFTDDDRIERMFDALHRQAGDVQILVLSCRQRAFRNLGGQQLRIEAVGGAP